MPTLPPTTALHLNPISDGSVYGCFGCNLVSEGAYLTVGGHLQGVVKFSGLAAGSGVAQAWLSLNHYGLPVLEHDIEVHGYSTAVAALDTSDQWAGELLGVLHIPAGMGIGEDVYFDVTNFVQANAGPYLAFNLRSFQGPGDVFSSLEYNLGHPSQLILAQVPEPTPGALMFAGLLGMAAWLRRRASDAPAQGASAPK